MPEVISGTDEIVVLEVVNNIVTIGNPNTITNIEVINETVVVEPVVTTVSVSGAAPTFEMVLSPVGTPIHLGNTEPDPARFMLWVDTN